MEGCTNSLIPPVCLSISFIHSLSIYLSISISLLIAATDHLNRMYISTFVFIELAQDSSVVDDGAITFIEQLEIIYCLLPTPTHPRH